MTKIRQGEFHGTCRTQTRQKAGVQLRYGVEETLRSHENLACHSRISVRRKNKRLANDTCPVKEYLESQVGELGHCGAM